MINEILEYMVNKNAFSFQTKQVPKMLQPNNPYADMIEDKPYTWTLITDDSMHEQVDYREYGVQFGYNESIETIKKQLDSWMTLMDRGEVYENIKQFVDNGVYKTSKPDYTFEINNDKTVITVGLQFKIYKEILP